jgi:hypothetical protein
MFVSLRRSAYAVTGSKLPTAVAQRPLHKSLPAFHHFFDTQSTIARAIKLCTKAK